MLCTILQSVFLLFTILTQHVHCRVAPLPMTPASVQGLRTLRRGQIERRQLSNPEGLSECFSRGSICELWNDLDSRCSSISSTANYGDEWYQCLCESGWLSTNIA